MKKIYIYAYTNMNLGDDIFIKTLCNRYSNTEFYIQCSYKLSKAFRQIDNLKVIIKVPYVDRILKKIGSNLNINCLIEKHCRKKTDGVVRIGGSIFMEPIERKTRFDALKAKYIEHDLPVFVIGANFGPYHSEEFLYFYNTIFRKLRDVCFRDQYSYNLFSNYPNIRVAPDVLFSFPAQTNINAAKRSVLISVIDLSSRIGLSQYKEAYQTKIVELCLEFSKHHYRITLMSFCNLEGDNKAINEISDLISRSDRDVLMEKYSYCGNIEEAIMKIANSQCLVASRLHAMILGWVMNKNVFPIIYSKKIENVIEDSGFMGLRTSIEEIDKIKTKQVFEFMDSSRPFNIEKLKTDAILQFLKLDNFLND